MRTTTATKLPKIAFLFALVLSLTVAPAIANAASIVPDCAINQGTSPPGLDCVLETFANIANIILGLTGSFALFMFVYGGFMLLSSGGSESRVSKGKEIIRNALIGIAIVLTAGALINYGLRALGVKSSFLNAPGAGPVPQDIRPV